MSFYRLPVYEGSSAFLVMVVSSQQPETAVFGGGGTSSVLEPGSWELGTGEGGRERDGTDEKEVISCHYKTA